MIWLSQHPQYKIQSHVDKMSKKLLEGDIS
jgi:hypothetical protein